MRLQTRTKITSVTNVQLAIATGMLFLAGGLSLIAIPANRKVNSVRVRPVANVNQRPVAARDTSIALASCGTPAGGWQTGKRYILTQNIVPPANNAGPCFTVTGDNITLDGQNYTVVAGGGNTAHTAIWVEESSVNVTIQNFSISNFTEEAILVNQNTTQIHIKNNTFVGNKKSLVMVNGNSHEIKGNTFRQGERYNPNIQASHRQAIELLQVQGSSVSENRFENYLLATKISGSSLNTFRSNTFFQNVVAVQVVNQSNSNTFVENTFDSNRLSAIILSADVSQNNISRNTFTRNRVESPESLGVNTVAGSNPTLYAPSGLNNINNNPVNYYTAANITVNGLRSQNNRIENNTFTNIVSDVFSITDTQGTQIVANELNQGVNSGIKVKNSVGLIFHQNNLKGMNVPTIFEVEGAATTGLQLSENNFCGNVTDRVVNCIHTPRNGVFVTSTLSTNQLEHPVNGVCYGLFANVTSCP